MTDHTACEDTLSLVQQQRDQAIGRVNTLSDENDDLRARAEKAEKERDHFHEVAATFRDKFNASDPHPFAPGDATDAQIAAAYRAGRFALADWLAGRTDRIAEEMNR